MHVQYGGPCCQAFLLFEKHLYFYFSCVLKEENRCQNHLVPRLQLYIVFAANSNKRLTPLGK